MYKNDVLSYFTFLHIKFYIITHTHTNTPKKQISLTPSHYYSIINIYYKKVVSINIQEEYLSGGRNSDLEFFRKRQVDMIRKTQKEEELKKKVGHE